MKSEECSIRDAKVQSTQSSVQVPGVAVLQTWIPGSLILDLITLIPATCFSQPSPLPQFSSPVNFHQFLNPDDEYRKERK